ncbi:MAG: hypothetical protein WKG01_17980 [Kofleriaceae bacterium]
MSAQRRQWQVSVVVAVMIAIVISVVVLMRGSRQIQSAGWQRGNTMCWPLGDASVGHARSRTSEPGRRDLSAVKREPPAMIAGAPRMLASCMT